MKEFAEKLIKRLEAASHLEEPTFDEDGYCNDDSWEVVYLDKAIEIANQLAEEYNQGWIPCSDRLPEVFDNVLISTIEGGRTIGHRCPNQAFGRFYDLHSFAIDNVIAWQHLPSPYKPEEKQKEPQSNFYSERFNKVM